MPGDCRLNDRGCPLEAFIRRLENILERRLTHDLGCDFVLEQSGLELVSEVLLVRIGLRRLVAFLKE